MMVLDEKIRDHQHDYNSFCGEQMSVPNFMEINPIVSSSGHKCLYKMSWCSMIQFTVEQSGGLDQPILSSLQSHAVSVAKNSEKASSLHHKFNKQNKPAHIDKPHSHGGFRWRDFTYFLRIVRISTVQCFLVCPRSQVCCNPIPKKGFFSLGICVPLCPQVNNGCSKPIKCCSAHPQPVFLLSTPSLSPTKHCRCINCGYTRHSDLLQYNTEGTITVMASW